MRSAQPGHSAAPALRMIASAVLLVLLPGVSRAQAPAPATTGAPAPRGPQMRPVRPPRDAKGVLILFSGKPAEVAANWVKSDGKTPAEWPVERGAMMTRSGDIISRERFTDFWLHVEMMTPYMPEAKGQGRGNSGVFMQGRYEVQVLDSYGIADPGTGDCGGVYSQSAPLVNACKPPLQWQAFDYFFRAPRFDAGGQLTEKARITVLQNGTVIQNNTVINGPTWGATFGKLSDPGPIVLQYHGNKVQYRNIWIIPQPLAGASHY